MRYLIAIALMAGCASVDLKPTVSRMAGTLRYLRKDYAAGRVRFSQHEAMQAEAVRRRLRLIDEALRNAETARENG